ncbi:MAG: hypothetical protein V3T72_21465, partial [Thermoanaerobaculia bacterium]
SESGGTSIFEESGALAALPPGARLLKNFTLAVAGNLPGAYTAELTITAGADTVDVCATSFSIDNSSDTGAGLIGSLSFDPEVVDAGDLTNALYTLENLGNGTLAGLGIRVIVLAADTGEVVGDLVDSTNLDPSGSLSASQPFSTADLPQGTYIGLLIGVLASGDELTLDDDLLTVVNVPPDCSLAVANPDELWPPDHEYVAIAIDGVVDLDGDPVTLTVTGVSQDEPTDGQADGNTCPDAAGVGTSQVSVRRELSGQGDGRVYTVVFTAEDGRGGICEGALTVCVPHDQGAGSTCVNQGALFDSTTCP